MDKKDIIDAADRAQGHRKEGLFRIPLYKILWWTGNRNGQGISANHVHEIAREILQNRTSTQRYRHVDVIEVPEHMKAEIFEANKKKFEADPLLPKVSKEFKYVCVTKTHFVHAQKLNQDGGRFLFNKKVPITWADDDSEGKPIAEQGPICAVYKPQIWEDKEAVQALCRIDNQDAHIMMEESEIEALSRVNQYFNDLDEKALQDFNMDVHLNNMAARGYGPFTRTDFEKFLKFRKDLNPQQTQVLLTCQWNVCDGKARIHTDDFLFTSKLDKRAAWVKVALILHQYLIQLKKDSPKDEEGDPQFGAESVKVKPGPKLDSKLISTLQQEPKTLVIFNNIILTLLHHYSSPPKQGVNFEADTIKVNGMMMKLVAHELLQVARHLKTQLDVALHECTRFTNTDRDRLLQKLIRGVYEKVEGDYRKDLVDMKLWEEDALPERKYPRQEDASQVKTEGGHSGKRPGDEVPTPSRAAKRTKLSDNETELFARLQIEKYGDQCQAYLPHVSADAHGLVDAGCGTENDWLLVRLIKVCSWSTGDIPTQCEVEYDRQIRKERQEDGESTLDDDNKEGWETVKAKEVVDADDLRAKEKQEESKRRDMIHPSMVTNGKPGKDLNIEEVASMFKKATIEYVLVHAYAAVVQHVQECSVFSAVPSEKSLRNGKLAKVFQVRAARDFKKNELCLFPALGSLKEDDKKAAKELRTAFEKRTIHDDQIAHAKISINLRAKQKRQLQEDVQLATAFVVLSPLLAKDKKNVEYTCKEEAKADRKHEGGDDDVKDDAQSLNPFWALMKGPVKDDCNMELQHKLLNAPMVDFQAKFVPKLSKGLEFTIHMPMATNVRPIKKGDVLCLPDLPNTL